MTTFRQNMTTEIQYSQSALYGRLCSNIEAMPVPMFTLNQDGVKLITTRRHPREYFGRSKELESGAPDAGDPSLTPPLSSPAADGSIAGQRVSGCWKWKVMSSNGKTISNAL